MQLHKIGGLFCLIAQKYRERGGEKEKERILVVEHEGSIVNVRSPLIGAG
jgi:hypothetical protein